MSKKSMFTGGNQLLRNVWTMIQGVPEPIVEFDPCTQEHAQISEAICLNEARIIDNYLLQNRGTSCVNDIWKTAMDEVGCSMLSRAAHFDSVEVMDVLKVHGVNIHTKDQNSRQAIHYAAQYCHKRALCWLIRNRADVSADAHGITPLHIAIGNIRDSSLNENRVLEVIRILLFKGANVTAKENIITFSTPLELVATTLRSDKSKSTNFVTPLIANVIRSLVHYDKNIINDADANNGGRTLIQQSLLDGNEPMVSLLLELGAKRDIPRFALSRQISNLGMDRDEIYADRIFQNEYGIDRGRT
jgi:ankyrin repeat protein